MGAMVGGALWQTSKYIHSLDQDGNWLNKPALGQRPTSATNIIPIDLPTMQNVCRWVWVWVCKCKGVNVA